jgi:hypothetical protein
VQITHLARKSRIHFARSCENSLKIALAWLMQT